MASISNDKNGNRSIQFVAPDRKRRTIRLGKVTKKAVETIKVHVESILAAKFSGDSVDRATAD
jgi:hypothetical protein